MKIWIVITAVLMTLSWMMKPLVFRKLSIYFGMLFLVGVYMSWTQYQSGCGFSIGECYAESLSIWHEWLKLAFVLISEISWTILGVFISYLIGKKILIASVSRARQREVR